MSRVDLRNCTDRSFQTADSQHASGGMRKPGAYDRSDSSINILNHTAEQHRDSGDFAITFYKRCNSNGFHARGVLTAGES